jgi:hypothetical protein
MEKYLTEITKAANRSYDNSPVLSKIADLAPLDDDIASLFKAARVPSKSPHLVTAAIHALLIGSPGDPLAEYFPTLGGTRSVSETDFLLCLGAFVAGHKGRLVQSIQRRDLVVKTDVRRAAVLRSLVASAWDELGRPARYALIDLGCSVGTNLLLDRFDTQVGAKEIRMCIAEGVSVEVSILAGRIASVELPKAERRIGIDLYGFDVESEEDRNWLLGSLMPEDVDAFVALRAAMAVLKSDPPEFQIGDAATKLQAAMPAIDSDVALIVMHSMMAHDVSPENWGIISEMVLEEAARRPVARVSMEIGGAATTLEGKFGPTQARRVFGRADFDGAWIKWARADP